MIEEDVRRFIVELRPQVDGDLSDEYPLLETNYLDSLAVFELVTFVEGEYGVTIEDEELSPENFGSIGSIARFIRSKQVS